MEEEDEEDYEDDDEDGDEDSSNDEEEESDEGEPAAPDAAAPPYRLRSRTIENGGCHESVACHWGMWEVRSWMISGLLSATRDR